MCARGSVSGDPAPSVLHMISLSHPCACNVTFFMQILFSRLLKLLHSHACTIYSSACVIDTNVTISHLRSKEPPGGYILYVAQLSGLYTNVHLGSDYIDVKAEINVETD